MKIQNVVWLFALPVGCVWVPPDESQSGEGGIEPQAPIIVYDATPRPGVVGIDQITLTAAGTTDPNNDRFDVRWRVIKPDGNAVATEGESDEIRTFMPLEVGTYVATVTATDQTGLSSEREIEIPIYNNDPSPSVKSCTPGLEYLFYNSDELLIEGDLGFVCVDLSDSYDHDGHSVDIRWEVDAVPPGGEALLLEGDGAIARFQLPVDGVYQGTFFLDDRFGGTHSMRFTLHRF